MSGIVVIGTYHGGTSTVAGILHHLGVDMGTLLPDLDATSPLYRSYEDEVIYSEWRQNVLHESGEGTFTEYLDHRADTSIEPWGVKLADCCGWWLEEAQPQDSPVVWVNVKRNPYKSAAGLHSRWYVIGKGDVDSLPSYENCEADVIHQHLNRLELASIFPPAHTVDFDALVADPTTGVDALITALSLSPTAQQRQDAIDFVDPSRKHF